ncbi:LysR family transcriptional regulator [Nioella aestuarii]|uniref:LysR family transcriptional regulator n=1 Tax=Nioella aestuarii TaxID=1662864 RepID=UPI003D800093
MQNWDDLKFALAVNRTGTMSAAAKILGTNVATVSRRIERLGEKIGMPLFIKSAGIWKLNPAVVGLLEVVETFEGAMLNEERRIKARTNAAVSARLRIGAPPFVTSNILAPRITESIENHPKYSIELHDRANGVGLGDMDIMLRAGQPEHGRLITRRIGELTFRLYRHKLSKDRMAWAGLTEEFNDFPPMRHALDYFQSAPSLRTTQIAQLFHLAQSTRMMAPLPELLAREDDNFIPLEPDEDPISVEIWLAYHSSRKSDTAIQDMILWISSCFQEISAQRYAPQVA